MPAESFFNVFEGKKAPEDTEDPDSEEEKILDGIDESMQIGEDLFDLYQTDALEYYLNLGENLDFMNQGEGSESEDDEDDKNNKHHFARVSSRREVLS